MTDPLAADIPFDPSTGWNPEAVARAFHETYERLDEDRTHESVVTSGDMAVELPAPPDVVTDLMAALEDSIAKAKEARAKRQWTEPYNQGFDIR